MNIEFAPSAQSTLGVEWELALVDGRSGELVSAASEVLRNVAASHTELKDDDEHPHIKQELLLNTVELVTGICTSVEQAKGELSDALTAVRSVERREAVGGTGPGAVRSQIDAARASLAEKWDSTRGNELRLVTP